MASVHPAPETGKCISPSAVLSALPEALRAAFVALPAAYGIALEHNAPYASPNLRDEQLLAAERALDEAHLNACCFGLRFEVYGWLPASAAHDAPEACEGCGSPSPFTCSCPELVAEAA